MTSQETPRGSAPAGAEPIEPGPPRGNRLLYGCGAAAVALVLVAIVCVVSFISWIRAPGAPLHLGVLVDERTVLYAELNMKPDDAALKELLLAAAEHSVEQSRSVAERTSVPVGWILGARRSPRPQDFEKTLPVVVTLTRREGEDGSLSAPLLTVSMPKLGNRMRFAGWVMSMVMGWQKQDGDVRTYRERTVMKLDADGQDYWLSMVGPGLLLSIDEATLHDAIDRLMDAAPAAAGGPLPEVLAGRGGEPLLFISARGGYSEAAVGLVQRGTPEFASVLDPMMRGAGAVTIRASLKSPDLLEGEIRVARGEDEEEDQDTYAGSVTAVLPAGELTMELRPTDRGPGDRHAWAMEVSGLREVALGAFEILGIDESRPESLPPVTAEPEPPSGSPTPEPSSDPPAPGPASDPDGPE